MSKTSPKPKAEKWWLARADDIGLSPKHYTVHCGAQPTKAGGHYRDAVGSQTCVQQLFNVHLRPGQCREIDSATMKLKAPAKRK